MTRRDVGLMGVFVPGEPEMARRIEHLDWSATSLGPRSAWPPEFETVVQLVLGTRFPMSIYWGPDLIMIYNDGYRAVLGPSKHPTALGSPAWDVWVETWDVMGPRLETVRATGVPTWSENERLLIDRDGFIEECFFTNSYSPVRPVDDTIEGVLDVAVETTHEVVTTRRMACAAELCRAMAEAESVVDGCEAAVRTLTRWPEDIVATDIVLQIGEHVVRAASNRKGQVPVPEAVREALRNKSSIMVGGDPATIAPAEHHVVPIGTNAHGIEGAAVMSLNPLRPFDARYRHFVELIASSIGNELDRTRRRNDSLGEQRHINETLQAAMLRPASDLPTVAARYVPASDDMFVGGDWYDVVDLPGSRRGIVVGDCVGHGLVAATAMSQLRSAARALLLDGREPADVISALDVFSDSVPEALCTTVVCAVIDRAEASMTYCRAGQVPPLIVGREGHRWLDLPGGPPLGVDSSQARTSQVVDLERDDLIVMYTDGLVERRGENIDDGLARLAKVLEGMVELNVQQIADDALAELVPETPADDVVLVVKRLRSTDSI